MNEWWKELVSTAVLLVGFGGWAGRMQQRMNDHEKAEKYRLAERAAKEQRSPSITQEDLNRHIKSCGEVTALRFAQGEKQFSEITRLMADTNRAIADAERAHQLRYTEMMKILLEMNKS